MTAFYHIGQIIIELHDFSCTIHDIALSVIVEHQRSVVEVSHTAMNGPFSLCTVSHTEIGFTVRIIVWCKECIEFAIVIFQRSGPLTTPIDSTFAHIVTWRAGQSGEDIVDNLPVDQIFRSHDRSSGHEMHGGADHIIGVTHTNHIGIGHVAPQHRIVHHAFCCHLILIETPPVEGEEFETFQAFEYEIEIVFAHKRTLYKCLYSLPLLPSTGIGHFHLCHKWTCHAVGTHFKPSAL